MALHPTDTIPGLTCWPAHGLDVLAHFKGRDAAQPFIFLAATTAQALSLWQPLAESWQRALAKLWPGPLTVAMTPSPQGLQLAPGVTTLAVRVPKLAQADSWFHAVLEEQPLPSTSANITGGAHATDWASAIAQFQGTPGLYIPSLPVAPAPDIHRRPSTLIAITGPDSFTTLRAGAVETATIEAALFGPTSGLS